MWYDYVNLTIECYVLNLIDEIMLMVHWICSVCGESHFEFDCIKLYEPNMGK